MTLDVGGKQVSGWRVAEPRNDTEWLVFELDGTLLADLSRSDELLALLAQLQPVSR